ncbi:hypothetical protein LG201_02250 [Methylobacillus gramineus]|uniref:surface-adhesin E family protein n=1 Tax=Methylobacillus gramineus TaxID=755169 RepID=UPI001CFFF759|nr:surface-adhesin E family protein [Methylobacillus gramineus]MCB5184020.1 hypothetical protein [Methylobacillus gramineus]
MKSVILSFVCFIFSLSAHAVEWESLVKTHESELLVDLDSYDERDAYSSILSKVVTYPVSNSKIKAEIKQATVSQTALEFDCREQTYRTVRTSWYDASGKLLSKKTGSKQFQPLSHDSTAQTIATLVCQVRRMVNPQA